MSDQTSRFSTIRLDSTDHEAAPADSSSDFEGNTKGGRTQGKVNKKERIVKAKNRSSNQRSPAKSKVQATYGPHGSLHLSQSKGVVTQGSIHIQQPNRRASLGARPTYYGPPTMAPYVPPYVPVQPLYMPSGGYSQPIMIQQPDGSYITSTGAPVLVQQPDGTYVLQYPSAGTNGVRAVKRQQVQAPSQTQSRQRSRSHPIEPTGKSTLKRERKEGGKKGKKPAKVKERDRKNTMELEGKESRRKIVYTRIIHLLSYGRHQWVLLTEQVDESIIAHQTLWTKRIKSGKEPPSKTIKKLWGNGHSIRQVSYGQGKWVVVADSMGKGVERWPQSFSFTADFPGKQIKKAWSDGHRVAYLAFCDHLWALITEKNDELGSAGQRLVVRNRLPKKDIEDFWKEDRKIHIMCYGDGQWVLIGEKTLGDTTQTQTFFLQHRISCGKNQRILRK